MRIFISAVFMMLSITGLVYAGEIHEAVEVRPHEAVVRVKGVVCSFCAYGTEKNLSRLNFLDNSKFGDNGVLMDIYTNRITLALAAGKPLDFKAIHRAIIDGGYDPVVMHLRLAGRVERKDNRYFLNDTSAGHLFELEGEGLDRMSGSDVVIQAHLNAAEIPSFVEGRSIKVAVDKTLRVE